jgi:hypothetical protein
MDFVDFFLTFYFVNSYFALLLLLFLLFLKMKLNHEMHIREIKNCTIKNIIEAIISSTKYNKYFLYLAILLEASINMKYKS